MSTLRELIYDVWQATHTEVTDSTFLDERDIEFFIHNRRATWLRNQLMRGRVFGNSIKQKISNLALTPVSGTSKNVLKTSDTVPEFIEIMSRPLLNNAILNSGFIALPINIVQSVDLPFVGSGKFNTNEIYVAHLDGYIYLISNADLSDYTTITIEGVFKNPYEVPGFTKDSVYPLPSSLWQYVKGDILQYDISIMLRPDKTVKREPKEKDNEEVDQ